MITCDELDKYVDQLCDLTAERDAMRIAKEATALLEQIETVPQRFLMQRRAAAVADLHWLKDAHLREIAPQLGCSAQSASKWLKTHGPTHYLSVGYERDNASHGDERLVLRVLRLPAGETYGARAQFRKVRDDGRRIAPAAWDLLEPSSAGAAPKPRAGVDAQQLWNELG